jgi:murein DD-endopeptidase MepM/ murein hydrolase activator NlpD
MPPYSSNRSRFRAKRIKFFTSFAIVLSLLAICVINPDGAQARSKRYRRTSYAPSYTSARSSLQNTNKKLQQVKAKVEHLKKKEAETSFILAVLQKRIENTSVKLADTQYRYEQTQRQIKVTDVKLREAETDLKKQIDATVSTVKRLYKYRYFDYLLFLFNSDDISTFLRRSVYFNYIIRQDNDTINEIKKKKEEIHDLKEDFKEKQVKIENISKKIAVQKTIYEDQNQEQEEYLQQIQTDRKVYEREQSALESESNRIAAMLRSLAQQRRRQVASKGSSYTFKGPAFSGGRMGWPSASNVLTSYFGYRVHPIFHTRKLHSGIDIGASYGMPIYAAADGVVVEAGWTGGYGKAVIIDHGNGIATLYGHSSAIYVSPGQPVKRGQLIAATGATGFATGPHLHFEVRVNGTPVDPLAYLR